MTVKCTCFAITCTHCWLIRQKIQIMRQQTLTPAKENEYDNIFKLELKNRQINFQIYIITAS